MSFFSAIGDFFSHLFGHHSKPANVVVVPSVTVFPNDPVQPAPVPVVENNIVRYFGYWNNTNQEALDHTNFIHLSWWDTDAQRDATVAKMEQAKRDGRKVILTTPFFGFGPTDRSRNGYYLRPEGAALWSKDLDILKNHSDNILAFWLLDEPNSVAWGDALSGPGGANYNPNLYNDIITEVIAIIKTDFNLPVALNYSDATPGLVVPPGLDYVGIECYGPTDWKEKIAKLKLLTDKPIFMLAQAFSDKGYETTDEELAKTAAAQWAYAAHAPRIIGLFPFLWSIEALSNPDDSAPMLTVGGTKLPLTRFVYVGVGKGITGK